MFHDALTSAHHRFCPPFPCPAPPNQKASSSSTQRSLATPQAVDFGGVKNLLSAFQAGLGVGGGQDVLQMPGVASGFGSLDDVVMGGVSESSARVAAAGDSGLVFSGVVRTENNGGFASVRTRNLEPRLDLSAGSGLRLRLSGGAGLRYKVLLRTDPAFDAVGYACSFDTSKLSENEWEEVEIPFASFKPVFRAKTVPADEAPVLDPSNICSVQLMLSKFEYDGSSIQSSKRGSLSLGSRPWRCTRRARSTARRAGPRGSSTSAARG